MWAKVWQVALRPSGSPVGLGCQLWCQQCHFLQPYLAFYDALFGVAAVSYLLLAEMQPFTPQWELVDEQLMVGRLRQIYCMPSPFLHSYPSFPTQ